MNWPELLFGGAIGWLTSWLFYQVPKEKKWDEEFHMDKQHLNRYLEKISFEIELIIEQLKEKKLLKGNQVELKIETLLDFRRLLHEDPFTLTFGEKNLTDSTVEPVKEARDLVKRLKIYIEKEEFNKTELIKFQSEITQLRLNLISPDMN